MNPTRKRRLMFVILFLLAAITAAVLITLALQENLTYLHTPTDVRVGKAPNAARFRLGGVVCEGSVRRATGTLDIDFSVTDRIRQVPVHYNGILPDMFKVHQHHCDWPHGRRPLRRHRSIGQAR